MTEKLDPFAPSSESLNGTKQQLLKAGILEEEIPQDWLTAILAAHDKWLLTTENGLKQFSRFFCFNLKGGDDDTDYFVVNNATNVTTNVKTSDVWFFNGVVVRGIPMHVADSRRQGAIPPLELEISEKTKNQCEGCGIFAHCIKDVSDPYTERIETLCNHCITLHEHPKVNDLGGSKVCELCNSQKCLYKNKNI